MSDTQAENQLRRHDSDETTTKIRIRRLGMQETARTILSTSYGN